MLIIYHLYIKYFKHQRLQGHGWLNELGRWDLTTHTSLSPIRRGFESAFVNYKKGYPRLAAASDKVYQWLAHGQWFSAGPPPLKLVAMI